MSKYKIEFDLRGGGKAVIRSPKNKSQYLLITVGRSERYLWGQDLERFAVNILKALKSKKLK